MSGRRGLQHGIGLIEISIGLAIVAILMAVASPAITEWIQSARIRAVAETIQNGLQLARATAIQRNTTVRFQLTDTVTSTCLLSTTGASWVVSQDDPSGACDATPSDATAPRIVQKRDAAEVSGGAAVTADQSAVVFSGLGRVTPVPAGDVNIDIAGATGTCAASGGTMRCLRVVVSTAGQIRMCDPARSSSDPQGC